MNEPRPVLTQFLFRTGHLFAENPFSIIRFLWRLGSLQRYLYREIRESPFGLLNVLGRIARQVWGGFLRGIVPVLLLGLLFGYLMNQTAGQLGGTIQLLFDSLLMQYVLRDLLVLATAVVIASRPGASIAGRFASAPAMARRRGTVDGELFRFDERYLYKETQSQLIATIVTAGMFYLILVYCVLIGYVTADLRGVHLGFREVAQYIRSASSAPFIITGFWHVLLCGAITGVVASAFGIKAAEDFASGEDENFELHTAIWESTMTSIAVSAAVIFASVFIHSQ